MADTLEQLVVFTVNISLCNSPRELFFLTDLGRLIIRRLFFPVYLFSNEIPCDISIRAAEHDPKVNGSLLGLKDVANTLALA